MKKYIIATSALLVIATSGFSQGFVNFSGGANASTRMSTNSVVGGVSTGLTTTTPNSYYYALFASSSQTSVGGKTTAVNGLSSSYVFNNLGGATASTGWVLVGIAANTANSGRFAPVSQGTSAANQSALNSDNSLTVQGIAGAANANFVCVGWSASIGSTLDAMIAWYNAGAIGGWIGQSGVATIALGDGSNTQTSNPFGTGTGQVGGILLGATPVPEPTTMALAALGGASLLLFRRRK